MISIFSNLSHAGVFSTLVSISCVSLREIFFNDPLFIVSV